MKKIILFLIPILFMSTSTFANTKGTQLLKEAPPKVTLSYAEIFDPVCTVKTGYEINPVWVRELKEKLPQWETLWNKEGNVLLKKTSQLISRPFNQKDFQVSLSLCSFPSMSAPLIINSRYALQSFTDHPIKNYVLINTIYHELLHNYIDSFLLKNTPLLKKYKAESKGVLNHIHLFALEKAVYLNLGWEFKLTEIIKKDENLPNGEYKRAWEIVNKKENYLDFISELKNTVTY